MDVYQAPASQRTASPTWRRFLAPLLLGGVATAGLAGLVAWQQAAIDRVQSVGRFDPAQLLVEHDHIASIAAFAPTTRERDAGVVLNPHIRLDGAGFPAAQPVWWTAVSEADRKRIKAHWLDDPDRAFGPDPWARHDDGILAQLRAYDHWRPESSGAYRAYLDRPIPPLGAAQIPEFEDARIPDLAGMQYLAKARLARGLQQGELRPALEEVRHLARLLIHGEDAIRFMIGLSLLASEREAAAQAVAEGLLAPGDWDAVAKADTRRARKAILAGSALLAWPDRPEARALFARPHVVGRCAMLEGAGIAFSNSRPTTEPGAAPFEADFASLRVQYDELRAASECTLPDVTRHLDDLPPLEDSDHLITRVLWMPYIRSAQSASVLEVMVRSAGPLH
jgi:hypothetical protein